MCISKRRLVTSVSAVNKRDGLLMQMLRLNREQYL